jgi:NADH-quinone oxidoreductase subunit J
MALVEQQLLETIVFALFAAVTIASSWGVVLAEDVWHSALSLGMALLSVAVYFVWLRAEFVAAMQILVYVGGVLILISFAVMLTRSDEAPGGDAETRTTESATEEGEPA